MICEAGQSKLGIDEALVQGDGNDRKIYCFTLFPGLNVLNYGIETFRLPRIVSEDEVLNALPCMIAQASQQQLKVLIERRLRLDIQREMFIGDQTAAGSPGDKGELVKAIIEYPSVL
jgi:hypothetical protein